MKIILGFILKGSDWLGRVVQYYKDKNQGSFDSYTYKFLHSKIATYIEPKIEDGSFRKLASKINFLKLFIIIGVKKVKTILLLTRLSKSRIQ